MIGCRLLEENGGLTAEQNIWNRESRELLYSASPKKSLPTVF